MKKYQFLTASFLISTPILADIVLQHQPGTFFNSSDMKQIKEQIRNGEDTIVLKDGTHLSSKITKFPELKFNFGTFPVSISDVAAVAISISKTGSEKIQVITGEGFNFVCDIPEEKVDIIQYFPSIEKPTHTTNQQIDLHTINYILFKERQASLSSRPQKLYRLEFKNGDQIPVVIKQENIELSNGWHDFTLPAKDIIDLNFDGGIYGVVRDSDGTEKEIDFTFVKEKYFRVQVAKSVQTLGIPWDYILNIHLEAEDPHKQEQTKGVIAYAEIPRSQSIVVETSSHEASQAEVDNRKRQGFDDVEMLKNIAQLLDHQNKDLKKKVGSLDISQKELLNLQDNLVSNLELEYTRTHMLRKALSELVVKWDRVRVYTKSLQNKFEDLRNESHLDKQQLRDYEIAFQEVTSLKNALANEKGEVERLTAELGEMNDKVELYQKQYAILKDSFVAKSEEISQLQKSQGALFTSLMDQIEQLTSEKQEQVVYEEELEDMINKLLTKAEEEKDRSIQLEYDLQEMTEKADAFEGKYAELQANFASKWNEIEQLKISERELEESLLDQIKEITNENEANLQQKKELEEKFNEVAALLESERAQAIALQDQLSEKTSLSEQDQVRSRELENELQEMTQKAASLESQIEELKVTVKVKWDEIEKLNASQHELHDSLLEQIKEISNEKEMTLLQKTEIEQKLNEIANLLESERTHSFELEEHLSEKSLLADQYQDRSSKMEYELQETTQKTEFLEDQIEELKIAYNLKWEEIENINFSHNELQDSFLDQIKEISNEKEMTLFQKAELEQKLNEITNLLESERIRSSELEEHLSEKSLLADQYQDRSQQLVDELQEVTRKATSLEDQIEELKIAYNLKWEEIENINISQNELQDSFLEQIKEISNEKEMTLQQKTELEQKLNDISELLESKTLLADQYQDQILELEEITQKLKVEKSELLASNEEFGVQLSHTKEEASRLIESLNQKEQDWNNVNLSSHRLHEEFLKQVTVLQESLRKEKEQGDLFHSELQNTLQENEALLNQKSSLHLELQKMMENIAEKEAELEALSKNLYAKEMEFHEFESTTTTQLESLSQKIQDLIREIEEKDVYSENLESELSISNSELKELKLQLAATQENLEQTENDSEFSIRELESSLEELRGELMSERNKTQLLKEVIHQTEDNYETTNEEKEDLEKQLTTARHKLEELESEIVKGMDALYEKNREVEMMASAQQAMQVEFSNSIDKLKLQIKERDQQVKDYKEKNFQLETQQEVLSTQLIETVKSLDYSQQQSQSAKERYSALFNENQKLVNERDSLILQLKAEQEELAEQKERVSKLTESLHNQKAANNDSIEQSHLNLVSELENERSRPDLIFRKSTDLGSSKESGSSVVAIKAAEYGYRGVHIVAEGENLNNISMRYYGTPHRWSDIYEANDDVITDVNSIKVGTAIVIPE